MGNDEVDRQPSIFFSYARADSALVQRVADAFREAGLNPLLDIDFLRPGAQWEQEILRQVEQADVLAAFISPASDRSEWVVREVTAFAESSDRLIIPITINGATPSDLPPSLAVYQAIEIRDDADIRLAAQSVAAVLEVRPHPPTPPAVSERNRRAAEELARDTAADRRGRVEETAVTAPQAVFLVHGHDLDFRSEVEQFLTSLGVQPVILAASRGVVEVGL